MRVEDIVSYLQRLGLGKYEAKTYYVLSIKGPMKALDISRESGVPQSKVYWALEELISKQLVEVLEGRPKEYRAIDADVVIGNLIKTHEKKLVEQKSLQKEVIKSLSPVRDDEILNGIWTLRGRHFIEFFNKASEMIDRSRSYVIGVTRDFSKSSSLSESVKRARRRGVKVRVISMERLNESNKMNAKWYASHGIDIRTLETKLHPRIVLVDGKEVLLRLDHSHEKKEGFTFNSVWSQDPSLVKVFDTYLKHTWDSAENIDSKILR